jgi:hypothetical protein
VVDAEQLMSNRVLEGYTPIYSTNGYSAAGTALAASAIQPGTAGSKLDGGTAYGGTSPFYCVPIWVGKFDTLSLQFSCAATGSPNGSLIMQSCDDPGNQGQGGNQSNYPDSSLINWCTQSFWDETLGLFATARALVGAQSYKMTVPILSSKWWRLQWTNTSGTGLFIARITCKGDGGR